MAGERLETPPDFALRVRAARGYMGGISQAELGRRVGMSEGYIKKIERGEKGLKDIEAQGLVTLLSRESGLAESFFLDRALTRALAPDEGAVHRLEQIEARQTEILDRLESLRTGQGLLTDVERETLAEVSAALNRLGRDVGRGLPLQRSGRRIPPEGGERVA